MFPLGLSIPNQILFLQYFSTFPHQNVTYSHHGAGVKLFTIFSLSLSPPSSIPFFHPLLSIPSLPSFRSIPPLPTHDHNPIPTPPLTQTMPVIKDSGNCPNKSTATCKNWLSSILVEIDLNTMTKPV